MNTPLSKTCPDAEFLLGDTLAVYRICPLSGVVEFSLCPRSMADQRVSQRPLSTGTHVDNLPSNWSELQFAHQPESLVQLKLRSTPEPKAFALGLTLRGSPDGEALRLESQDCETTASGIRIRTRLIHPNGCLVTHVVDWRSDTPYVRVHGEIDNRTDTPITVENFSSFSLGLITPFDAAEACERLYLHRFRSTWSSEGRHERLLLEDLNLERSWAGYGVRSERWGQIGSMPVRGFFPWGAVEDVGAGVFWGAQLDAPGSWQLELARHKDKVTLSGGLPNRDFGAWWKTLGPGESFAAPAVTLACVEGDLEDLCHALTRAQRPAADARPALDRALPMVFNEWCTSWGEPTHADMLATAELLSDSQTRIMVIDDGWATKPEGQGIQFNGDWEVDLKKFPGGLRKTTDALREKGFIPGIWFEMEVATRGTKAFDRVEHLLHRDGRPVEVGTRRFWDFRNPKTVAYLSDKLIARLRDDGFGYLKIDYNDTLPEGVDPVDASGEASGEAPGEAPGEELRKHLVGVQAFLRRIQREVPGILIENCSSGGHRLEPSFMGICAMGSFSDAHETISIPIIAANLQRLILPEQSQIWCVMHPTDSLQRLRYGLAATFLGRMAISGGVKDLSPAQMQVVKDAQDFLADCTHILREGKSRILRDLSPSWNAPRGWQAVLRQAGNELLIVLHVFGGDVPSPLELPLPKGPWEVQSHFGEQPPFEIAPSSLKIQDMPNFSAAAWRLAKV
ncbi:MAG: alpha-galactosidase [Verrucomicrobia bacterium]|nr:alpha-galactosidase [Verrucomicrobiota bacterium]MCH8513639.1 alpha-galactosidase [Kiritimatiellia bacterium]